MYRSSFHLELPCQAYYYSKKQEHTKLNDQFPICSSTLLSLTTKESWFGLLLCQGSRFGIEPSAFTFSNHTHNLQNSVFLHKQLHLNNYNFSSWFFEFVQKKSLLPSKTTLLKQMKQLKNSKNATWTYSVFVWRKHRTDSKWGYSGLLQQMNTSICGYISAWHG